MMQLDQNAPPAPGFPNVDNELAVQRYFEELGLHELNDPKLVNEKKLTLALYKLLFQECRFRPEPYEYRGITLRCIEAGWCRGVKPYQANKQVEAPSNAGKYKQHSVCSARFIVTFASLPSQTYHCNVWVYLDGRSNAGGPTLYLNVRVEYSLWGVKYLPSTGKVKTTGNEKIVSDFQLHVSKLGWENVRNDENQCWEICLPILKFFPIPILKLPRRLIPLHPRSMPPEELRSPHQWLEEVPVKGSQWIKNPSEFKARWDYCRLSRLPMAEKVTWDNSKECLAQLLYYAISRAEEKFREKREVITEVGPVPLGKALGEALKKVVGPGALGKASLETLEEVVGPEALRKALDKALSLWGAPRGSAIGKARLEALGKACIEALDKTRLETLELEKSGLEALGKAFAEAYEKARQEADLKARMEVLELEKARLEAGLEALDKARLETLEEARSEAIREKQRWETLELEKAPPMVKTGVPQLLEAGKTIRKTRRTKKKRAKKKAAKKKGAKKGKRKITGANITPS